MATHGFQVNVPSGFSNPDVQNLSATEKDMARAMGLSEDEFRRSKFDYFVREQQRRDRGRQLGVLVEKVLTELGREYQLDSVTWNPNTWTWRFGVTTAGGSENVILQEDVADQIIDFDTPGEFQRLRNMVLFGLGRTDLIFEERG